jgi:hypothetical protein
MNHRIDRMTDEDFERHALAILQRELGLDGLARFLRLNSAASGDYTRSAQVAQWRYDPRHHG